MIKLKKTLLYIILATGIILPQSVYSSGISMVPSGDILFGPGLTIGGDITNGDSTGVFTGASWMAGFYFLISLRGYLEAGYSAVSDKGYVSTIGGAGFFYFLFDFGAMYVPSFSDTGGVFGLSIDLSGRTGLTRLYVHWITFNSPRIENQVRFGLSFNINLLP